MNPAPILFYKIGAGSLIRRLIVVLIFYAVKYQSVISNFLSSLNLYDILASVIQIQTAHLDHVVRLAETDRKQRE